MSTHAPGEDHPEPLSDEQRAEALNRHAARATVSMLSEHFSSVQIICHEARGRRPNLRFGKGAATIITRGRRPAHGEEKEAEE
jgi:hypothetical protein